ncbi:2-phytyl-1,4-naphtoquinone methyltransferase [Hyella patelloides LEGE 07179]|uniref:2-phytyl-1,4-naphtoquinone methyltransferase n=1 Tax=Hyella patelloides LEGE 07179 TaxID=945734 RepID=A0A563W448_9CYAN|nr:bifunctional demethylmenaquinone methyltransferase/2-methoxy-6-polyprenyl-1,4-benzoquinol methylase UbiE [Hyella patelloides]VEP18454.1 2-phytyl-1,4-naphtoquinone methyltransferase [Hyella patelloides LEGE 07179]
MKQNLNPEATEIKAIFDRIATEYDNLNDRLSFGQHRIWKMMAVKWIHPRPGDTALDICCGSGDLAFMLAKKVGKQGKVIGLDFACQQLQIAAERQQKKFVNFPLQWLEGDALNLPFADNYFHCATMGYGLRNVTDIPLCLREIYRVLKPGAYIAILDFHRPDSAFMDTFQQWYLNNIVIPTAQSLNMTEEYAYLIPSLAKFPTGKEQVKLADNAGFTKAVHYPLVGGMMGVLVLKK